MRRDSKLILFVLALSLVVPNTGVIAQQSRVFVTSARPTGDIGGLAGADAVCTQAAQGGALGGGPWVAWLSTSSVNAVDRLLPTAGPFVRATETSVVIADDVLDLTDGSLDNSVLRDENGVPSPGNGPWTGTDPTGFALAQRCLDWTTSSNAELGFVGLETSTSTTWTQLFLALCDQPRRIYCFEVAAPPAPTIPGPGAVLLAVLLIAGGLFLLRRSQRVAA